MAQTEQLQITRSASNQPWGFRLQGGKDFNMPIIIQKVNAGSPAEKAGLHAGDAVITIGGQNAIEMRHKDCQDTIIHSGNNINMVVQRGGLSSLRPPNAAQPTVIKPNQPNRNRNPFRVIKNLDTPDGSVKALVHNQFNSPMPLYSEDEIAETLSAQTEVLAGGALGVNFKRYEPQPWKPASSEVYKMIHGDDADCGKGQSHGQVKAARTLANGVDFKKNEKKYDGNMSEVLRMVQDMDLHPKTNTAPPEEVVDSVPLDPDYSGLNSIKSRSMRSLVVKPDGQGGPQTSVHAPRITPQPGKLPPQVAPKPSGHPVSQMSPQAAPTSRGPPGMRSTSATMIKTDPSTGSVKLVTAVDTETKHFNAFNRTPQSFKPSSAAGIYHPICPPAPGPAPAPAPAMAPAFAPAPAPAPAFAPAPAPVTQQYQQNQQNQQTHQTQQFQQTQQIQQSQHTQQTSQQSHVYNSGASGISQVDYTSFVPQRKGGTTFAWPPKPTEVDAAPHPFAGGHVEVSYPGSAPAPAPAPAPTFVPKPAPPPVQPKPAAPVSFAPAPASFSPAPASFAPAPASFAPAPASFAPAPTSFAPAPAPAPAPPKQVHFGQPTFAPTVAPKPAPPLPSTGGPGKLGFNGGLPGLEGLGGGAGGKGVTAGRNAPRRGRGTLNPAASSGLRIPVCHTCGNQIRGPFITALGQCWCPNCFVCATPTCRRELEHIGFVEVEGKTRCETCWETDLAPVCFKCQRRIKGDCLKAIGKAYHPECFACSYCGGLFGNSAFFLEDGLPYCENDWNELFTTKCVGCGFPIEAGDRWVEALNKNFHSQCFKCAVCRSTLDGAQFYAKAGRAVCKAHAGL